MGCGSVGELHLNSARSTHRVSRGGTLSISGAICAIDRTPHSLALIKHREINNHSIEVVAQYFSSLQWHCKSSVFRRGLIMSCRHAPDVPAMTNRPDVPA
jgi:hypothetical protein